MKIAYIVILNFRSDNGVANKIRDQIAVWVNLKHEVRVFCMSDYESDIDDLRHVQIFIRSKNPFFRIFASPKKFIDSIEEFQPDVLYLRYHMFRPYYLQLLRKYPSFIEVNSNDVTEVVSLRRFNATQIINKLYNQLTRDYIYKYSKGLIFVTKELMNDANFIKYRKPSIILPNGIDLSKTCILKNTSKKIDIPQVVFMGTQNWPWHGIDKIVQLAKETVGLLFFHLIGIDQKYYTIYDNIQLYGSMNRREYEKVISNCDIGLGTLALHRKAMSEACPLKTREYIAYGMPVIIGYKETFLNDPIKPEWILQIDNKEDNVISNKDRIISYCYKYKDYIVTRDMSYRYIDIFQIESKRVEFIESQLNI